jgi:hypothetical protein
MTWYARFFAWLAQVLTVFPGPPPIAPTASAPDVLPAPPPEPPAPVPAPPDGQLIDRDGLAPSGTFIWKPVADVGSMAAVILPWQFSSLKTPKVTVYSGTLKRRQEVGRWNGAFSNGLRMAYRLTQPGKFYGRRVRVVVERADGTEHTFKVPSGAARYEERFGG